MSRILTFHQAVCKLPAHTGDAVVTCCFTSTNVIPCSHSALLLIWGGIESLLSAYTVLVWRVGRGPNDISCSLPEGLGVHSSMSSRIGNVALVIFVGDDKMVSSPFSSLAPCREGKRVSLYAVAFERSRSRLRFPDETQEITPEDARNPH